MPGEEGRQDFSCILQVPGEQGWLAMVASCSQTGDRLSVHQDLPLMWWCWNLDPKFAMFFANHWVSNDKWTIAGWWFGTFVFSHIFGIHRNWYIFQRGWNHQPDRVLRCDSMSAPAPLRTGMLLGLPGPYDPCVQTMSPLIHSNVGGNLLCKIYRGVRIQSLSRST